MPKKTLWNLDHTPTLEDLRAFFKENDFSAAAYTERDYDTLPTEAAEIMARVKAGIDAHWEPIAHEMGLKSHSSYYGKDNPLIAMRDNLQTLAAEGVYKLISAQPEKTAEIISQFMDDDGNFTVDQELLLHNAVEKTMQVMEYKELAEIIQDTPTHEDFKPGRDNNHRAIDFNRQWNHSRAKTKTVLMSELDDDSDLKLVPDSSADVEAEALSNIQRATFMATISEDDKTLLNMLMNGQTQEKIAEAMGYKTHSTVTKRLQKLKKLFENCA